MNYFLSLVKIDSESKEELYMATKLKEDLIALGAQVSFDNANEKTGGNCGNLYAYFPGKIDKEPLLFCAHMDTVVPGKEIKPKIENGIITSDGTTILGADDKSGIAEFIEAVRELKEQNIAHAPIEALFTISEEIGLLGAKYLDYSLIKSKIGYALDSHKVGNITIGAPSQNSMKYVVIGKEAHAGAEPENGVNAIKIAAEAIAKMPLGRIDEETTANIGIISGGKATNIVPNQVVMHGEARSHSQDKLKKVTTQMSEILEETAAKYKLGDFQAKVEIEVREEYQAFHLNENENVVQLAKRAAEKIGLEFETSVGGGGSDANIFNRHGLKIAVAGTGMNRVHTVQEFILTKDLENGKNWVKSIIKEYSS